MKLLIDIDEKEYKEAKEFMDDGYLTPIEIAVSKGIPLEDIKEQYDKGYKDGVKETFIEELEKIKAEICQRCNDALFGSVSGIVDKHISELKGENNAE